MRKKKNVRVFFYEIGKEAVRKFYREAEGGSLLITAFRVQSVRKSDSVSKFRKKTV